MLLLQHSLILSEKIALDASFSLQIASLGCGLACLFLSFFCFVLFLILVVFIYLKQLVSCLSLKGLAYSSLQGNSVNLKKIYYVIIDYYVKCVGNPHFFLIRICSVFSFMYKLLDQVLYHSYTIRKQEFMFMLSYKSKCKEIHFILPQHNYYFLKNTAFILVSFSVLIIKSLMSVECVWQ